MSICRAYEGEQARLPEKRKRLKDEEIVRFRQTQSYARRLAGWTNAEIADLFKISERHVRRIINQIPGPVKQRIRGAYNRGEISLG